MMIFFIYIGFQYLLSYEREVELGPLGQNATQSRFFIANPEKL